MASAGPAWLDIARCGHGGYPPSIPSSPETSMAFAPTDRPDPPFPRIAQNRLNTSMTDSPARREVPQYSIETKLTQTRSGTTLRCYMRNPDGHLIEVGQTTGALRHP